MKKLLLLILTLVTVTLVACGGQNPTGPVFDPFIGGQNGLVLEFIPGMPPVEEGAILDNGKSSFSIGLKLDNQGEYDIDPADGDLLYARVRGILPGQFDLTPADLEVQYSDPLRGARKNIDGSILDGQFATVSFDNLRYLPDSQGDVPKTFVVDVCYDYSTKSTTSVCVADDVTDAITSDSSKSICTISGPKATRNSAGPVQVTEFKQQPQGANKISVIFTVSHVGMGDIYKWHGTNADPCDDSLTNQDEQDQVLLEISLPDQSQAVIECTGGFTNSGTTSTGVVRLYDGNPRTVTCSIEEASGQTGLVYEDLLQIDMFYRYTESLKKTINIKNAGN